MDLYLELCGLPPSVQSSTSDWKGEEGQWSVTYKCNTGHDQLGSSIVNCTNGKWTTAPMCRE